MARGIPAIINFTAIVVYTRILNPGSYGEYVLILAAVALFESVIFRWLSLGLLRFIPAHTNNPQILLSVVFFSFLGLMVFSTGLSIIFLIVLPPAIDRNLIIVTLILLWASAWFQLNLELVRSELAPVRYGALAAFKSLIALSAGTLLVFFGFGAYGPILGILLGMLISTLSLMWREWRVISVHAFEKRLVRELIRYGLPLTATFALMFVINSSDRFLLTWFIGTEAAGLYAPGYDLAHHSIGVLMTIVNLAAYPLAVRALESYGESAAQKQLQNNVILLFAVAIPAATGFALCSSNIANVLLGEEFRESAIILIPWIALATVLSGFKSYYLDLSFQLGRNTIGQVWTVLIAALVNLLLNILWIPEFGLPGAAYATVVAYLVAVIVSWKLGKREFALPVIPLQVLKIFFASMIMAAALWFTLDYSGWLALLGQAVVAITVYTLAIFVLDLAGIRNKMAKYVKKPVYSEVDTK
jgi:O-antigen/teichoic acid export membrane protein